MTRMDEVKEFIRYTKEERGRLLNCNTLIIALSIYLNITPPSLSPQPDIVNNTHKYEKKRKKTHGNTTVSEIIAAVVMDLCFSSIEKRLLS